ncbi:MAG: sulfurtransferase [Betaproteobacteria bacterium]|jgi:thiosulfate/3-mercaptopyruvate sulfurtransferase
MNKTTLISVVELAAHLADPAFVVFDCRHELTNPEFGQKAYAESHLSGALFAHLDRDLAAPLTGHNGRHPLPDPEIFAAWLARMGVANDKQVIGYDNAGGVYASRLWWMLRWMGHQNVAVLDGGWQAWLAAGHPVTAAVPVPTPARFSGKPGKILVDAQYVLDHLQSPDMVLVDARANDRYHGQNETIDPVGGHIPGARNRFFKDNLTPQGFFKLPEQLREEFGPFVGTGSPQNIVSQCGSGVTACHNLLAMEIAGLRGGRLYPGSWSEWIADPSRPRAT